MTTFDDLAQPEAILTAAQAALTIQVENNLSDEDLLVIIHDVLFDEALDENSALSEGEMATLQSMVLAQVRELKEEQG